MTVREGLLDTVRASIALAGVDAATVERSPGSTIVPSAPGSSTPDAAALLELLATGATVDARIELGKTIGEGGMGVVRQGRQRSLDRPVAVKSLKPEHRDPRAVERLLREAWVTGHLDHPNVVPVYDIVAGPDGSPLIILKKIEGVAWAELIHDAAAVKERFGANDLLEWNLGVLTQVCHAIELAHDRGVLHRDLKPENVMIGAFGEVYVVDWGLAVMIREDAAGRLPAASDATALAGTPHYMAPEMLGGGQTPNERTDVYLLGSVLHEIATGLPPHRGDNLMAIISSILRSEPELPADVPSELAAMIRRAMHRDPAARYESVQELRHGVRASLRARDADRIARRGLAMLAEMVELIGSRAEAQAIQRRFIECRVAFRDALELWPEHEASRRGMAQLIQTVIGWELDRGEPEAASVLLAELEDPPPELRERVESHRVSKAHEASKLAQLRADHDITSGSRARFTVALVIAVVWVATPILMNSLVVAGVLELAGGFQSVIVPAGLLALVLALWAWAGRAMTGTKINRTIGIAAVAAMALNFIGALLDAIEGTPPWEHIHDQLLMFAGISSVVAVAVEPLFWVIAAAYVAGYLITPFIGIEHGLFVIGVCNIPVLYVALFRWRAPAREPESARPSSFR